MKVPIVTVKSAATPAHLRLPIPWQTSTYNTYVTLNSNC